MFTSCSTFGFTKCHLSCCPWCITGTCAQQWNWQTHKYCMQHSPSWEAGRFSASQEIPHILWNPKVHYRIHKCPPHPTSWRCSLILCSHLWRGLPSGLFLSSFPTKALYNPLLSSHTRYMPLPSHSSRFYHPNNIWWQVQIIKLFIM